MKISSSFPSTNFSQNEHKKKTSGTKTVLKANRKTRSNENDYKVNTKKKIGLLLACDSIDKATKSSEW